MWKLLKLQNGVLTVQVCITKKKDNKQATPQQKCHSSTTARRRGPERRFTTSVDGWPEIISKCAGGPTVRGPEPPQLHTEEKLYKHRSTSGDSAVCCHHDNSPLYVCLLFHESLWCSDTESGGESASAWELWLLVTDSGRTLSYRSCQPQRETRTETENVRQPCDVLLLSTLRLLPANSCCRSPLSSPVPLRSLLQLHSRNTETPTRPPTGSSSADTLWFFSRSWDLLWAAGDWVNWEMSKSNGGQWAPAGVSSPINPWMGWYPECC